MTLMIWQLWLELGNHLPAAGPLICMSTSSRTSPLSDFVEMLSESRKYQALLTIAEQSTQQQFDQKLTEVILANVGTIVAFRSGSPADAKLLGSILEPFVIPVELMSLPAYNFYARSGTLNPTEVVYGITCP